MSRPTYGFRSGQVYRGLSPDITGRELERIRRENGGKLYTEAVLRAAESRLSPLHDAFTWDDSEAAEQHRLFEARQLIREVVVVFTSQPDASPKPAFVNVRISRTPDRGADRYYQAAAVIVTRPDEYAAALEDARTRLASAQQSLVDLQSLAAGTRRQQVSRAAQYVRAATNELSS